MTIKYLILSLIYKRVITTSEFKKLIGTYINDLNNVIDNTIDYMDANKDGYISIGEILYLFSVIHKKVKDIVKAIK